MLPPILQSVTPDWTWDREKLWNLELPTVDMSIDELLWHFDYPFWDKEGTDDWNLTPGEYIKNPEIQPSHAAKVQAANLEYPIHIIWHHDRYRVLDGLHRLVKSYILGKKTVVVKIIPEDSIALIRS